MISELSPRQNADGWIFIAFPGKFIYLFKLALSNINSCSHSCPQALIESEQHGGKIITGGKVLDRPGNFVTPTLVLNRHDSPGSTVC